jgi:hypothetical protein
VRRRRRKQEGIVQRGDIAPKIPGCESDAGKEKGKGKTEGNIGYMICGQEGGKGKGKRRVRKFPGVTYLIRTRRVDDEFGGE